MYLIFLFSIVAHELGHLLVGKCTNVQIKNVKFKIIGISAEFVNENRVSSIRKILVLISGPLTNLIIAIIFWKNENIFYTNLLIFIFNMFPIIPLDGGKILFYIINLKFDYLKSLKIIILISKIILITLSVFYCFAIFILKNIVIFFVIVYLWLVFFKEEKNFEWYIKIYENLKAKSKNNEKYLQED